MKVIINNKINGFFIITPHFNDDGKIKCVYNKFDNNKTLEYSVDEENYHIRKIINKNEYVLYTYNNNLIITCENHNHKNNYNITIYYYWDPDVHVRIFLPDYQKK